MTQTSREAIFAALFAQLSAPVFPYPVTPTTVTPSPFVTVSRQLKGWSDVQPALQPACYISEGKQKIEKVNGIPSKQTLSASLYIYVNANSPQQPVPQTPIILVSQLNACVDAVFSLLAPQPDTETNQLGNPPLVTDCRIVGDIETDEGTLEESQQQAVAIIPVEIVSTL